MDISRKTSEGVISFLCLASIVTAIIGIDSRVRDRFWHAVSVASDGDVSPVTEQLRDVGLTLMRVAEEHSIAQAPLVVFAVVALVLVVFMLRT